MSSEPPPASRRQMRFRWAAAIVWLAAAAFIIFCADRRWLRPMFAFITAHPGLDKAGHFLLVGGTAFLLNLALRLRTWDAAGRSWLVGGTLVAVVFTIEEISQTWLPSRSFDLLDLVCDYSGIVCFGWLAERLFGPRAQV